MALTLAGISMSMSQFLFAAIIAGGLGLMILRLLAADMEFARRLHALHREAAELRERQAERLRSLRPVRAETRR